MGHKPSIAHQACRIGDEPIPLRDEERSLGAYLSFTRKRCKGRITMTKKECSEILTRIEGLHLHLEARSHLVSAMVLPKALYAASVSPPARKEMAQLRAKCTRAVWGQANRWRAAEAVFNLFTKAHVVDPVQKFSHDALVSMRRVLRRRPALIADFERILEFRLENPGDSTPGPVAALIQACFHANVEIGRNHYGPLGHAPQARDKRINPRQTCKLKPRTCAWRASPPWHLDPRGRRHSQNQVFFVLGGAFEL